MNPDGEPDEERQALFDLRLITLCLVNEDDVLLFDFPVDDEGNEAFEDFAESLEGKAATPWALLAHEVLKVNGYIEGVDDELIKKVRELQANPERLFAYRLGAKLGILDVDLFDCLTDEKWQEWQAVAIIDGWHNGWLHMAQLMAHITNETNRVVLTQTDKPQTASKRMNWPTGYELAEKLQTFGKRKRIGMTPEQAQQFLKSRG